MSPLPLVWFICHYNCSPWNLSCVHKLSGAACLLAPLVLGDKVSSWGHNSLEGHWTEYWVLINKPFFPLVPRGQVDTLIPRIIYQSKTLRHWGLNKRANILLTAFSNTFSWRKRLYFDKKKISIRIKFVYKGPIDGKSALVQVLDCNKTGNKSLPEAMVTQVLTSYGLARPQ